MLSMTHREPIAGSVAQILNARELVINRGAEHGVSKGMRFAILDTKADDIRDPDTGEILGSVDRPKVTVEIVQVKPKLSLGRTFKKRRVNVGGSNSLTGFAGLFAPPKWETHYETLRTTESTWEDLDESESYVKIADPVIEVLDAASLAGQGEEVEPDP